MAEQGLFQLNTLGSTGRLMGQERDMRIRQAMADNQSAGGNFYANLIAKARQQQAEAIRGVGPAASQKLAEVTGGAIDFGIKEDSRLTNARRRDADMKELQAKYASFNADGKMTTDEWDTIISDLTSKGYMKEAADAQAMSLNDRKMAVEERLVGAKENDALAALFDAKTGGGVEVKAMGTLMNDGNNNLWQTYINKDGSLGKQQLTGKPAAYNPEGAVGADKKGQDTLSRIEEALGKAQGTSDISVEEENKKSWAKQRNAILESASTAGSTIRQLESMIGTQEELGTVAGYEIMLHNVGQFLGMAGADETTLIRQYTNRVIDQLERMGMRPTDEDMEILMQSLENLGSNKEANIRGLKLSIETLKKQQNRAKYIMEKKPTMDQYYRDYDAASFYGTTTKDDPTKDTATVQWGELPE